VEIIDRENINIRKIRENDLERIYQIENISFKTPYSKRILKFFIKNSYTISILIEKKKEIIGYAIGILKYGNRGHLVSIAIDPEYRNLTYGKLLLERMLDMFKDNDKKLIHLEVRKTNQAALKLYQNFGFKIIGEKKDYYSIGEDAFIMELRF
jgi:ribosomal-protein-alanine N-acetyltransferase